MRSDPFSHPSGSSAELAQFWNPFEAKGAGSTKLSGSLRPGFGPPLIYGDGLNGVKPSTVHLLCAQLALASPEIIQCRAVFIQFERVVAGQRGTLVSPASNPVRTHGSVESPKKLGLVRESKMAERPLSISRMARCPTPLLAELILAIARNPIEIANHSIAIASNRLEIGPHWTEIDRNSPEIDRY
jgi:hypothetical protein